MNKTALYVRDGKLECASGERLIDKGLTVAGTYHAMMKDPGSKRPDNNDC